MGHQRRNRLFIGHGLDRAGEPLDRLFRHLHHGTTCVSLPMRSRPDQPRFPGIAVAHLAPMVLDEGARIGVITRG